MMSQSKAMYTNVVVPISTMKMFPDRWIIRARVIHKSSIHTKNELSMFSVELRDEHAEINTMVMSNLCEQWRSFYDEIQLHEVYYIAGGELTRADRTFVSVVNENELKFTDKTTVDRCYEAVPQIPTLPFFKFVKISDILLSHKDTAIDIIGIGKCTDELDKMFPPSYPGRNERTIEIMDPTGSVQLTLYGDQVERFKGTHPEVVAVKGAKIVGADERFLKVCRWGHILVNPKLPEAYALHKWILSLQRPVDTQPLIKTE